jgi:WD40 repeat protein
MTSAAFLPSGDVTSRIAVGSHVGEIRIFDAGSGGMIENYAGHEEIAVNLLQTAVKPGGEGAWLLSSTRREIKLWDVDNLDMGCVKTFEGCRSGRFNHAGTRIVAVEQRQSGPPQVGTLPGLFTFNIVRIVYENVWLSILPFHRI